MVSSEREPGGPMTRLFHLYVDQDLLTDEMFEFVTDPRPSRNQRTVVAELEEYAPDAVPVLENMLLDGVDERRHVAAYVSAAIGPRLG
jgi:hypothetical protein